MNLIGMRLTVNQNEHMIRKVSQTKSANAHKIPHVKYVNEHSRMHQSLYFTNDRQVFVFEKLTNILFLNFFFKIKVPHISSVEN